MFKNNKKTMKTIVFSLVLVALTLIANHLNAQNDGSRGLFGMGKSSADYDYNYNSRGLLDATGIPGNSEEGISNYGIGETVPVGSGLLILSLAGAGYAALRRKRSRKGTALLLACVMLLGFTQCKKEQVPANNENEGVRITLTVDGGASTGSATDGSKVIVDPNYANPTTLQTYASVTFEAGDVIYVGNGGAYCGYLEYNGSTNQFEGTVNPTSTDDYLHFYFMGNKGAKSQPTSVNITDQTSKYPVISYAHSKTFYNSEVSTYTAKLQNYCAIVRFTTTNINLPITIEGMNNTVTVNFAANNAATSTTGEPYAFSKTGDGQITLHAESGTDRWAILLPQGAVTTAMAYADGYVSNSTFTVPAIAANTYHSTGIAVAMTDVRFSVGESTKVLFAPGNLQAVYAAANTSTCTWQFAPTQYSFIGNATANTAVRNNYVITAGTVDMFGWVGEHSSLAAYGINLYTASYGNAGDALKSDWGVAASGLGGHTDWRTPDKDEWDYLFNTRANASSLYGHGSVNGVNGMIILPDNWTLPSGLSFTAGNSAWTNSYTIAQWEQMEKNGAVFLPATGVRQNTTVDYVGSYGYYWSSNSLVSDAEKAYRMGFYSNAMYARSDLNRYWGVSVRLVRTVN